MRGLRRFLLGALAIALLSGGAAPSGAVPSGEFNVVGTLELSTTGVEWLLAGQGLVSLPSSGSFVGLQGTAATLTDLTFASPPPGVFLSFAAAPTLSLSVLSVPGGVFSSAACGAAPAAGQTCTPTGSPLSFVNFNAGGRLSSLVSFVVEGTATDASGSAPITGIFTAQFAGLSYQSVLAALATGSIVAGYSAAFEVVPEPGTLALVGAALAALAWGRRRA
jgi:hypothetical protein